MNDRSLALSLLSSLLLHGLAILCAALFIHHSGFSKAEFFTVQLLELPPPSRETSEPPPEKNLPTVKALKPKPIAPVLTSAKPESPARPNAKNDEIAQTADTKKHPPAKVEASTASTTSRVEAGGSESDVSAFGRGETGLLSGSNGGGGSAVAGSGRGAGAPGLRSQQPIFRTNREAKPIQPARPAYPAMALRAGLESDVTLTIEIDLQGTVTKAEIVKSGGAAFDEEALKAVKQSRFEPAQRDGQNVPAEFTYVYRFRLQR